MIRGGGREKRVGNFAEEKTPNKTNFENFQIIYSIITDLSSISKEVHH